MVCECACALVLQLQGTGEEEAAVPVQLHRYFTSTEVEEAFDPLPAGGPDHLQPHSVASRHALLHPMRAQYVQPLECLDNLLAVFFLFFRVEVIERKRNQSINLYL